MSWQLKAEALKIGLRLQKSTREIQSATVRRRRNGYQEHTYYKAADKTEEKGTSTTAGRHNGAHSEVKRAGDTEVPLDTGD